MNVENRTIFGITRFYILVIAIVMCCLGCSREYDLVISDMRIYPDSIKVHTTQDIPAIVIVEFEAYAGGCIAYHSNDWWWEGNTCYITVKQKEPDPRVTCHTSEIVPHPSETDYAFLSVSYKHTEQIIIGNLNIGDYKININGHILDFQVLPRTECQLIETTN